MEKKNENNITKKQVKQAWLLASRSVAFLPHYDLFGSNNVGLL